MIGKLYKKIDGTLVVLYDHKEVPESGCCKQHLTAKEIKLHPDSPLPIIMAGYLRNESSFDVNFGIVDNYAKLI